MSKHRQRQRGIVSLFIVIFAALLLTVITLGFIRTMMQDQQRASANDLSQSAYDSAVAGVEDGKRVIRKCIETDDPDACNAIKTPNPGCDTVAAANVVSSQGAGEVKIRSQDTASIGPDSDDGLNQAYTCVKVKWDTDDVTVNVPKDRSIVVPLKANADFKKIRVRWMHRNTGQGSYIGGDSPTLEQPDGDAYYRLPAEANWSSRAASLLRVQTVLPSGATINSADLDTNIVSTAFLRPANITGGVYAPGALGQPVTIGKNRAAGGTTNEVTDRTPVPCSREEYEVAGGYACLATLDSPDIIPMNSEVAFIRLTSLYRDTSVQIELLDASDTVVSFNGVQPTIDSTGRASNIFRRISSRVSVAMNPFNYPEYAVDITGSLCKDYFITVKQGQAGAGSPACEPKPTP